MFKKKKTKIAVLSIVLAAVMLLATLTVYAYFTTKVYVYTDEGKQEFQTGMQLQLLFGELTVAKDTMLYYPSYTSPKGEGNVVYTDKETGVAYDPDAEWGSAKNPYVISETRHLQNLSALQSVGYFDLMYLNSNFEKDKNGEFKDKYPDKNNHHIDGIRYALEDDMNNKTTVLIGKRLF